MSSFQERAAASNFDGDNICMDATAITLAVPENGYHFRLLHENSQEVDLFLVKGDSKLLGSNFLLGRNFQTFDADFFSPNIPAAFRENRQMYGRLGMRLLELKTSKLIIFGDAKPFHRFLIDFCIEKKIQIELWEDGLGYYLGNGIPIRNSLKNLIKIACGCHARQPFSEQYRRDEIGLRDRFVRKNLIFRKLSLPPEESRQRIAFIGQPLVEDGYMSLKKYCSRVERIVDDTGLFLDYLPHPREGARLFDVSKVNIVTGVNTENWLNRVKYVHCTTAFSTALVNISEFQNRSFCAAHFGLHAIAEALDKYPVFGVEVISRFQRIHV